jgi:hypothetical protein
MATLILVGGHLARARVGNHRIEEKPSEFRALGEQPGPAAEEHNLQPIFPIARFSSPPVIVATGGFPMTRSKIVLGSIAASAFFAGGVLVGQTMVTPTAPPKVTLGANFPNLQAAQKAIIEAWNAATKAQEAYPNNPQVVSDINQVGRYLNQAIDELEQVAKDENGR